MEITKREVIASITIIAVMMILGFVIAGKIDAYQIRKNSEYYKAIQITEPDQFRYCMELKVYIIPRARKCERMDKESKKGHLFMGSWRLLIQ